MKYEDQINKADGIFKNKKKGEAEIIFSNGGREMKNYQNMSL